MEIERNAKLLCRREHGFESPIVEKLAVDCPVDHRSDKPQPFYTALQLRSRALWMLHGEGRTYRSMPAASMSAMRAGPMSVSLRRTIAM
jgi:hypothetical protein